MLLMIQFWLFFIVPGLIKSFVSLVACCRPVLLQYTLFVGLDYTTATFAATFGNLLPVVTFLISLAFR
jgi:drug/metabolite transporter (DMT)-like permease